MMNVAFFLGKRFMRLIMIRRLDNRQLKENIVKHFENLFK